MGAYAVSPEPPFPIIKNVTHPPVYAASNPVFTPAEKKLPKL